MNTHSSLHQNPAVAASRPPRRVLRSIGAVFAGIVAIFVLSMGTDTILHATGVFPPWMEPMAAGLWMLALAYRFVFAIAAAYLVARLAPGRPMFHAMVFGGIGVPLSFLGAASTWHKGPEFGPDWFHFGLIAMSLPCSYFGGRLVRTR